jgi:hypothetical protein
MAPYVFKTEHGEPPIQRPSNCASKSMNTFFLINDAFVVIYFKILDAIISLANEAKHIVYSQVL